MTSPLKRRVRACGLAAVSALALTAASVFGFASAAQADYVSPEELSTPSESGWYAENYLDGEEDAALNFTDCTIVFSDAGGYVGYVFTLDARPTGTEQVAALIQSFYASVTEGGGTLEVLIDRAPGGIADISLEIPVGVHGIDLDAEVELSDSPELGLPDHVTVQEVLDALDATGDVYYIVALDFHSTVESEVQWLAFGSETYWFGTDADWFTNDPSCGTIVPDPTPEPQPAPDSDPAPKKPVRVETGL